MKKIILCLIASFFAMSAMADVYLTGTWDGWAHSGDLAKEVGGQVWLDLEANTTYEFKVYDSSKQNPWYGLSNAYMRDGNCTGWRLYNGDGGNCRFTTTFAGQYKFAIGWEDAGGSDGWVPTVTAMFPTVEPVATGELFGTYQQHDMPIFKENMTDPQKIGVDFYIATCGQHAVLRAISTGATTFNGDNWATQLRRVNAGGATQQEIQTCTNVSNKNHYTSGSCVRELNTTNEDIRFHFFVNGSYPAGVDGGYRKTTDFAFNRYSINNPIADAVAPVLDVENTTFVDNGDGTITVTLGAVTADDEYFYYVGDRDHNMGDISLDNTITIAKPTVQDGTTYTFRAYAVDFNGNMSAAKEYEIVMPFDENINLALSGKASAGYWENNTYSPEKANDGNADTRWNSWGFPEGTNWWMVKLQNAYVITSIKANYRDVSGTCTYEGSVDGTNWFTMASDASLSNGIQTYPIDNLSAQYIRFSASRYATVNEFEVYGSGLAAQDATPPTITSLSEVSSTFTSATLELIASDEDDNGNPAAIQSVKVSDVANGFAEQTVVLDGNSQFTLSGLKDNTTYTFHIVVFDKAGNQASDDIEVVLPFNTELNLAENMPSQAGVHQNDNVASRANDGNINNFWTCFGTGTADQWWWSVDLENLYQVNHIYILYNDHEGTYTLNYSADGTVWHEYQSGFSAQQVDGNYVSDFTAPVVARYFKFVSTAANVGIKEFEVYGTGFAGADGTAPEIETFEATATTTNSVTLHIVATDKDDNEEIQPAPALTISDLANGLAEQAVVLDGDNKVVISGLKSNKTYDFLLTATDLAGNTTNDNLEVALPYDTDFDWTEYATEETIWAGYSNAGDTPIKAVQADGHWGSYGISGDDAQSKNWWAIDLGVISEIRRIVIDFEAERNYNVEYSFDDKAAADAGTATWLTAMANVTKGDADILNPNFAARMIRIHAQSKDNMGINRIHIYGSGWATTDAVAPVVTVTEVSKTTNTATLKIVATDADDAGVAHPVKNIAISGDNGFTTIENAILDGDGNITLNGLKDNTTYTFHVLVTDRVGLTAEQDIEVRVAFNTTTNLALASNGGSAEAASWEGAPGGTAHNPSKAIDGKAAAEGADNTYWGTWGCGNYEQSNTFTLTLAASYNISSIVLKTAGFDGITEHNITLAYSVDKISWTPFVTNYTLVANETNTIPVVVTAKYLRLTSSTNHMITIKEFEVYGSSYDDGDTEAPEITGAALVGEAGEESAVVSVEATDNVGVYGLQFVDEANGFNVKFDYIYGQNVTLEGLAPGATYHFNIYALDRAGNVSEAFALELTTQANENLPTGIAPIPNIPADRVTSIYSDTYTSAVKSGFQWLAYNSSATNVAKVIAGNHYMHYTCGAGGEFAIGVNFHDAETNVEGVNISTRTYMHIDVWSKEEYGQGIGITLNDNRLLLGQHLNAGWNSIKVSLIELQDLNSTTAESVLSSLKWIKLTEINGKVLAVDNIYFYEEEAVEVSNLEWSTGVDAAEKRVYVDEPVTITGSVDVRELVIRNNGLDKTGSVVINPEGSLVVRERMFRVGVDPLAAEPTTAADVRVKSDESHTGALAIGHEKGLNAATIELYSKAVGPSNQKVYQYIGVPFSDMGSVLYQYYGSWMYQWSESAGGWTKLPTGSGASPWLGYAICYKQTGSETSNTYVLDGTILPTQATMEISLGKDGDGHNMIANSWTAPIRLADLRESDFTQAEATVYIYNTGSRQEAIDKQEHSGTGSASERGQWNVIPVNTAPYLGISTIAPMQGFLVNATGNGAKLRLDYSRVVMPELGTPLTNDPLRAPHREAAADEVEVLRMTVTGSFYQDRVYLLRRSDFTTGFDNGWDGRKMFGDNSSAPSLYVGSAEDDMAVAAIPDFEGMNIGFGRGADELYTLTFDYSGTEPLYLYDVVTDTYTLISDETEYTFFAQGEDAEQRFVLTYSQAPGVSTGISEVKMGDNNLTITNTAGDLLHVLIYDAAGRVWTDRLTSDMLTHIILPDVPGVYCVSVEGKHTHFVEKLVR